MGPLAGIFTDVYGDEGISTLNLFYRASVTGGVQQANDDVSEILWLEPAAVEPQDFAFRCCRDAFVTSM